MVTIGAVRHAPVRHRGGHLRTEYLGRILAGEGRAPPAHLHALGGRVRYREE